jgi:hypothetical protein
MKTVYAAIIGTGAGVAGMLLLGHIAPGNNGLRCELVTTERNGKRIEASTGRVPGMNVLVRPWRAHVQLLDWHAATARYAGL